MAKLYLDTFFSRGHRGTGGQAILETVIGIVILIPLTLTLVDVTTLVLCKFASDSLAKNAARAAADHEPQDSITPSEAAHAIVSQFPRSPLITSASVDAGFPKTVSVNGNDDHIMVRTTIRVNLPVPVPSVTSPLNLKSESIQPWIARAQAVGG